tara:strand:- start:2015 stop:3226 length:1212 start_codon:yes stop_codon:yes gene_type:complete
MAQTLAGMLTGISPQGISPTGNYEQQAMALGANASRMMQGGLQGLTGRPDKSLALKKALSSLDMNKTEDLKKLIQISQATGDFKTATALAAKLQERAALSSQRSEFADYLSQRYGTEGETLRKGVLNGTITEDNFDKFVSKAAKLTQKNITYTDDKGEQATQLVNFDEQGNTFDEKGDTLVLPADAKVTITGRTEQDVVSDGISGFSEKEYKDVRNSILSSRAKIKQLASVTPEKIDKYLTLLGTTAMATGSTLSKLSGLGGDYLNEQVMKITGVDLQEFAGEGGVLFGDLENYFNKKRHDITGAAAAVAELKSLRKGILSGETSPAVAKARLKKVLEEETSNMEMNFTLLEQGGLSIPDYFDSETLAIPTENPSNKSLTVEQQESTALIKAILATTAPEQEG